MVKRTRIRFCAVLLIALASGIACATDSTIPGSDASVSDENGHDLDGIVAHTTMLFSWPERYEFFELPYPHELHRNADGTLDFSRLTSRAATSLVKQYFAMAMTSRYGHFSTTGATFLRFSAAIEENSLPQTWEKSLLETSSIVWVNVEPTSPHYGTRVPFRARFEVGKKGYIDENHLVLVPVEGFVMEPRERYAVLMTDRIRDHRGNALTATTLMQTMLQKNTPTRADPKMETQLKRAWTLYQPVRDYLDHVGDDVAAHVVGATIFKTGDPSSTTQALRTVIDASDAPKLVEFEIKTGMGFDEITGTYRAPNFQNGNAPYASLNDGGAIQFSAAGLPLVAKEEILRFALTIPQGTMPAEGWPVMIYADGTGSDYRSFIENGLAAKFSNLASESHRATQDPVRYAVISVDPNLHGARIPKGVSPEYYFFNFENPYAAVDNVHQAIADYYSLIKFVSSVAKQDWWRKGTRDPIAKLDTTRMAFFGHSQGAIVGVPFLTIAPEIKGAVLSGCGGGALYSLLEKEKPFAIKQIIEAFVGEAIDEFHPVMQLVQQLLDSVDPMNYVKRLALSPSASQTAKHLFLSEGIVDHYTPNRTTEALALAGGIPLVGDLKYFTVDNRVPQPIAMPVRENLKTSLGNSVTAGWLQYRNAEELACQSDKACSSNVGYYCDLTVNRCRIDGHFVLFYENAAQAQYRHFLATLMMDDGIPTISQPLKK